MTDRSVSRRARRRKEARPEEILQAAIEAFASNGYERTRVDDVATRAGISKGTVYLYFKSKADLFREVVRSRIVTRIEGLRKDIDHYDGPVEQFIRLQLRAFIQQALESEVREVVRLVIGEAHRFPDLAEFYYQEVISRGMGVMEGLVRRGVERGEFRPTGLEEFPQLMMAPAIMAVVWKSLFEPQRHLDVERYLDTHLDLLLNGMRQR